MVSSNFNCCRWHWVKPWVLMFISNVLFLPELYAKNMGTYCVYNYFQDKILSGKCFLWSILLNCQLVPCTWLIQEMPHYTSSKNHFVYYFATSKKDAFGVRKISSLMWLLIKWAISRSCIVLFNMVQFLSWRIL